jgi:hypothetical protein
VLVGQLLRRFVLLIELDNCLDNVDDGGSIGTFRTLL